MDFLGSYIKFYVYSISVDQTTKTFIGPGSFAIYYVIAFCLILYHFASRFNYIDCCIGYSKNEIKTNGITKLTRTSLRVTVFE